MNNPAFRMVLKSLSIILASSLLSGVAFADLYISCTSGNDANPGTAASPLRSLKKAGEIAASGTKIHITSVGLCATMYMSDKLHVTGESKNLETWCFDCP